MFSFQRLHFYYDTKCVLRLGYNLMWGNFTSCIKVLKSGSVDCGSGNLFPGPDWATSGRFPDPESANEGHFPDPELAFPDLVVVALSQMR